MSFVPPKLTIHRLSYSDGDWMRPFEPPHHCPHKIALNEDCKGITGDYLVFIALPITSIKHTWCLRIIAASLPSQDAKQKSKGWAKKISNDVLESAFIFSKSDEFKQLKKDKQLAKVNKDKMEVGGIYLDEDEMLPSKSDEGIEQDEESCYNNSESDEASSCNESESDDESEGGAGDTMKRTATRRGMHARTVYFIQWILLYNFGESLSKICLAITPNCKYLYTKC